MNTHYFRGYSSGEVYDETQTSGAIKDGDVLVIDDSLYGVLIEAWPTMVWSVDGSPGEFHQLSEDASWDDLDDGKYKEAADLALRLSAPDYGDPIL